MYILQTFLTLKNYEIFLENEYRKSPNVRRFCYSLIVSASISAVIENKIIVQWVFSFFSAIEHI